MMRTLFRLLRVWGDVKAASNGPSAYGKRRVRREAHKALARSLRRHDL